MHLIKRYLLKACYEQYFITQIRKRLYADNFVVCAVLAYGFDNHLPLLALTLLHVAQIVLAGFFKISYVLRLVAQQQLGLAIR